MEINQVPSNDLLADYARKVSQINKNSYITKLPSTCSMFLVSHYRFITIIDEWTMFLGILIAKVPTFKEKSLLVKHMGELFCNGDENNCSSTQFNNYLHLYEHIRSYPEEYYKKYAIGEPYEVFCDAICESIKLKSWQYTVALLASIKLYLSELSNHLNKYTKSFVPDVSINYHSVHAVTDLKQAEELFSLVEKEDGKMMHEAIDHGNKIMNELLENLSKMF